MSQASCANCVYSFCSFQMQVAGFATGFGSRPLCSNHPEAPGQLKEVAGGDVCRNWRPKPPAPAQPAETVKRIPLAHGGFVLVDAADFEWLSRYKWSPKGSGRYAARREKGKTIYMHREIMNAPPGMVVDHSDGNGPNNCRSNLRVCTAGQNRCNQAKRIGCKSRFKGVYQDSRRDKWFVMIRVGDKPLWFGYFDAEGEAARAYDRLAVELFGEFAYLNFPQEWTPERRQAAYAQKEALREAQQAKGQRDRRREEARRAKKKTEQGESKKEKVKRKKAEAGKGNGKKAKPGQGQSKKAKGRK